MYIQFQLIFRIQKKKKKMEYILKYWATSSAAVVHFEFNTVSMQLFFIWKVVRAINIRQ